MKYSKFVIVFLLLTFNLISQKADSIFLNYSPNDIKVSSKVSRSPQLLVNQITRNCSTEKEKFDAIFAWVATNINYNYRVLYSGNGVTQPRLKSILKHKQGVCIDYAYLMDTLCFFAGINNVTVLGYAKDNLYDVNDSVYFDNHAWNAVRLDNQWYLYDVTWSTGQLKYEYTRWSKFILKLIRRIPIKRKIGCSGHIIRAKSTFCDGLLVTMNAKYSDTIFYYKYPRIRRFLLKRKLRLQYAYEKKLNTDYYLSEPAIFQVTHIPDDPVWLLNKEEPFVFYEGDSAYYHFDDSLFRYQHRKPISCPSCINKLSKKEIDYFIDLKESSLKFNPKNHILPSYCQYPIADYKFVESRKYEDSLTKITIIDSALKLFYLTQDYFKSAFTDSNKDYILQTNKNNHKSYLVRCFVDTNKLFIKEKINQTKLLSKYLNNIDNKTNYFSNYCIASFRRNNKLKYEAKNYNNKKNNKLITSERLKIINYRKQLDSLIDKIDSQRKLLDSLMPTLKNGINYISSHLNGLLEPILISKNSLLFQLDFYKKPLVEQKRTFNERKKEYLKVSDSALYNPSKNVSTIFDQVFENAYLRNAIYYDLFKSYLNLYKQNEINDTVLINLKKEHRALVKEDFCWMFNRKSILPNIINGFERIKSQQNSIFNGLIAEIKTENLRAHVTQAQIKFKYRRIRKIISNNNRVTIRRIAYIKKEKRLYLKALAKQRREERKASRINT